MISSVSSGYATIPNQMPSQQAKQEMFTLADQDGDGGLSLEEFKSAPPPPPPPGGAAGGPPPSSSGEAQSIEEVFSALDTDEDGFLSQTELEEGRDELGPKFGDSQISSTNFLQLLEAQESSSSVEAQSTQTSSIDMLLDLLSQSSFDEEESNSLVDLLAV